MFYVYGFFMYMDVLCTWMCYAYGCVETGRRKKEGGRKDGMHSKREPTHRGAVGKINSFDINRLFDHKLITGTSKFGICVDIASYYTYLC